VVCEAPGSPGRVLFETELVATPALSLTLFQNHPNPFNPRTEIRFYLRDGEITLEVFDVAGRRVAILAEGRWEKGYHAVSWNGRAGSGAPCASGLYLSRLKAGSWSRAARCCFFGSGADEAYRPAVQVSCGAGCGADSPPALAELRAKGAPNRLHTPRGPLICELPSTQGSLVIRSEEIPICRTESS